MIATLTIAIGIGHCAHALGGLRGVPLRDFLRRPNGQTFVDLTLGVSHLCLGVLTGLGVH